MASIVKKPSHVLTDVIHQLGGCDSLAESYRQNMDMSSFVGMEESTLREIFKADFLRDLQQWVDIYTETDNFDMGIFPNPQYLKAAIKAGLLIP